MPEQCLSLGIDLSTSATGVVLLKANDSPHPALLLEREVKAPTLVGMKRVRHIVAELLEVIHQHHPHRIVVEGYSLNLKNASSVVPLVELGGLLRFMLHIDGLSWFDPRATEVKKFVTGKGNSAKDQVMLWVFKRWGHTPFSNNTADAYALAAMGLAQAECLPGLTVEARKIAGAMILRSL